MHEKIAIFLLSGIVLVGGGLHYAKLSEGLPSNTANMLDSVTASVFASKTTEQKRILIDVRTEEEYVAGHLPGARNIDFNSSDFTETISTLDKNDPYSIYCRSGNRSGQALKLMKTLGFTDVLDLEGGIIGWVQSGETL